MKDVLVRARDVARTYRSGALAVVAVHGVSCEVSTGDRIAVLGSSGSGKSTLLLLLAGLERPTVGTIDWPALGTAADLRPGPVAMVFQGPSLLPPLDVLENVAFPLLIAGLPGPAASAAAHDALADLGIEGLAQRLPEELSGGQALRVAVARALVGRPRLILADEPTGQLDHEAGGRVIDALLAAAGRAGAALVVATHDPAVQARLDQHWVMTDGRLGALEDVS